MTTSTTSPIRFRIQHNSMQFSDTAENHAHDARAVFDHASEKGNWVVTGTESGASPANHELRDWLIKEAKAHGYLGYFHKYGDWVAYDKTKFTKITHGWAGPFIPGTKGKSVAQGAHSPRGITWMSGTTDAGVITVGSCHFLTKLSIGASGPNTPLLRGIKAFGAEHGKGRKLAFLNADANTNDKAKDVFAGIAPFTTVADELKTYYSTHGVDKKHGAIIDVISSYNADGRVKAKSYDVLDDSQVKLYSDHFMLEAVYEIAR